MRSSPFRCSPAWRCLRLGCQRCDPQRAWERSREQFWRDVEQRRAERQRRSEARQMETVARLLDLIGPAPEPPDDPSLN